MDLINKRYRIIKSLTQNKLVSSYLVSDVMNNHEIIQLNIINSEHAPESIIDFLIEDFVTFTNIENPNIVKVFDFGLINSIYNKQIGNKEYFYTNKYYENHISFYDFMSKINENNLLDIFIQVCRAVNYLHLKGFVYGELNTRNIIIDDEDKDFRIILKEFATIELDNQGYWAEKDTQISFKAPELIKGNKKLAASDIYSMGILLIHLCRNYVTESKDINKNSFHGKWSINNERSMSYETRCFYENIIKIAEKMTDQYVGNRYKSVTEVVADINGLFNKEYRPHSRAQLEKLAFNTKIVGRNQEINNIISAYDNFVKNKSNHSVFVYGEQGIGKTRLLKEIDHILTMKKANVYSSFTLENSKSNSNKAFAEILRKMMLNCEEEIVERYESELIKFIPELVGRNKVTPSEILSGEKEKYRLISRLFSFTQESIKNKPAVFIIDNAQYLDDFSTEVLRYLSAETVDNKNIMIILAYSDGEHISNEKFLQYMNNNSKSIKLHLDCLNKEETALMVKGIMNMPIIPLRFGARIYESTYGNPLFIEETLKEFLSKKILYIHEDSGKWNTPYNSYEEMPMASSMEQALLNQIKEISKESCEVLSTIAIFNSAISTQIIARFFSYSEVNLERYISDLSAKGILCKKIEDRGFVYDFYNKVLKNLIYNRLNKDERKKKHENAVKVLENIYESEGRENKEELIYHLEKAGDKNKVIKYCLENGRKMEKLKIMDEAISNYKRAFTLLSIKEEGDKKIELLLKIGDIYSGSGNVSTALGNYKKAYKYAVKIGEERLQVDALNNISHIYYKKNELEKALKYITMAEGILLNITHMEGYLENKRMGANVYMQKQELEKVLDICANCIELCGDEYIKIKGYFYNILGNLYSSTLKLTEALESYEMSMRCFEEINYSAGILVPLNNIGAIYGDYYQDSEKAIDYFNKMKEISEKDNIISSEVLALTNLASCYFEKFHYDDALRFFKEALRKSKKIEYEAVIFFIYNYLSYVLLRKGDFIESYEYYSLAKKELEQYPEQGRTIAAHYEMGAELYLRLGDIDTSYELIKKAIEICNNDDSNQDKDCKVLLNYLEIFRAKNIDSVKESIENIKIIRDTYINDLRKSKIICDLSILLYELGYKTEAVNLLEENAFSEGELEVDIIKAEALYLKGLINKGDRSLKDLIEALNISKKLKNKELQWKINTAVGDYYYAKEDYFYAANYYFEACEIIKNTTLQLPKELRLNFFKINDMIKPFNKINAIKKKYSYIDSEDIEENMIIILSNEELDKLFNYDNYIELLNNKYFIKSAQKIYSSILPEGIQGINDIIMNLREDSVKTLDCITKLLTSMVLSTRTLIILEEQNSNYSVIAASDGRVEMPKIKLILDRAKETKKPILITEFYHNKNKFDSNLMPEGIKAIMCIPIIVKENYYSDYGKRGKEERSKRDFDEGSIKGYLYMESERILNSFNEKSLNKCMELTSFISFLIDNYQLKITAAIDKLTGALTRKFLEEALTEHIDKTNRLEGVFSIVMFDLDNFKGVNDRFGHQTGDEVLKAVSRIVIESIRKEDIFGRYGGEEFIIILPGADTLKAREIAERIRINVDNKNVLGDKRPVTVSMGIATYPHHAKWKQELVEKADQALYVAKETGRNRCRVWESEFSGKAKGTNKLSGIVSGNAVQDSRNVLAMVDLIELIKTEDNIQNKIFNMLGRIIEITEAQTGMLFVVKDNSVCEKYGRKIFEECWAEINNYNEKIIQSVIDNRQGIYAIDWDDITGYDLVTGMPEWNSVMVVPLINAGTVKGVLYLTVPIKNKEFKFEDLNFVNTLAQLFVAML